MGLIFDIINIAPQVKKRIEAGEDIRAALLEELAKEIAQSQAPKNYEIEHDTLTTASIIAGKVDIDNGYIYDKETGETIKEL